MTPLSVQIRRAVTRWLFVEQRAHYVAEEYGLGARTADAIALWLEREQTRGIYHDVTEEVYGKLIKTSRRVGEKTRVLAAEVRIAEVKISRSDFLGGIRKGQISNVEGGLGSFAEFCYLAIPADVAVLRLEELPRGWGLIRVDLRYPRSGIAIPIMPSRLDPSHPLSVNADRLAHALAQSSMWRLYAYNRPAPNEMQEYVA